MSERARIAVDVGAGEFRSVYVHDGYNLLPVLQSCYGSPAAAGALLDLGDLSQVKMFHGGSAPVPGHSFKNPKPNFTVAYHRDRGDALRPAKLSNWNGLLELCDEGDADFLYVFRLDGGWSVLKRRNW